ncbi:hypothetical protein EV363DRAFT_1586825 [Boletus edulis]|nr:hypothetical protein EV363DRAFT_1586825 [Boletus edulis]
MKATAVLGQLIPFSPLLSHFDPACQTRVNKHVSKALLRKSLLGEELVNTQFHLFSARSSLSDRVVKPRVLCANNILLAKSSTYFLDCDVERRYTCSLIRRWSILRMTVTFLAVPPVDEYGYGSDSDLEECNDPIPVTDLKPQKDQSTSKDDDVLSDDGSVSSDMFVMSPEQPKGDAPFASNKDEAGSGSVASSETAAVQEPVGDDLKRNQMANAMRLRSLGSRHVLVKDTAFQTWYSLLNYLYTDKFNFLPLRSAMPVGQPRTSCTSTSSPDEPRCSAKSMYRLACKVRLDDLRDEAFHYIRSNLTEHNILQELACGLVSAHPDLLEMELDVLYAHITSPTIVAGFPVLARRIANKELAHGADIVVGIHTRLLKASPTRTGPVPVPLTRAGPGMGVSVGEVKGEDEDGRESAGVACDPAPAPVPAPAYGFAFASEPSGVKLGPAPSPSKIVCNPPPAPSSGKEGLFGKASQACKTGIIGMAPAGPVPAPGTFAFGNGKAKGQGLKK